MPLEEFFRALPVSLLIVASIWTLVMIFILALPSISAYTVQRDDQKVLEDLRRFATWMVAIAAVCGVVLGICIPMALRYWKQKHERKDAV